MIHQLNVNNFFTNYIIHPFANELSDHDKLIAIVTSVAIAILTLGTVHLAVYSLASCNIISYQPNSLDPNEEPSSPKPIEEPASPKLDKEPIESKPYEELYFKPLEKVILSLETDKDSDLKKKGGLFKAALDLLIGKNVEEQVEFHEFSEERSKQFIFSKTTKPAYFSEKFKAAHTATATPNNTPDYYDYENSDNKKTVNFWVDFANMCLGGGSFGTGCVQEEIMVAEMPDFAAWIAAYEAANPKGFFVRRGSGGGVDRAFYGSPHPCILKNVHRVIAYNNEEGYGGKFFSCPLEKLYQPLEESQVVHVIAVAAPRLPRKEPKVQFEPNTLKDIFNTIMAACELAIEVEQDSGKKPHIHSGKLGCGVFNNHPLALYLMHRLALTHLGDKIEITLHDFSDEETAKSAKVWDRLVEKNVIGGDKTLEECIEAISKHLLTPKSKKAK